MVALFRDGCGCSKGFMQMIGVLEDALLPGHGDEINGTDVTAELDHAGAAV